MLDEFAPEKEHPDQWNVEGSGRQVYRPSSASKLFDGRRHQRRELSRHELGDAIFEKARSAIRRQGTDPWRGTMRYHERMVMLSVLDGLWKDHLLAMDHLKEGIGLRGYAQQDPLVAYKKESFDMFEGMMAIPGGHGPLPVPYADPRTRRQADRMRLPSLASPFPPATPGPARLSP